MKGHVRERPPRSGNWSAVIDTRDALTGARKRKWITLPGVKGKRQAEEACAAKIKEMRDGISFDASKATVAEYFDRWLAAIKPNVEPRTHERYTEIAKKNLGPLIGDKLLPKLTTLEISGAYAKAIEVGTTKYGPLSPRTVLHMHRILNQALQQAVEWNLIAKNPAHALRQKKKRPKVEKKAVATISADVTGPLIDKAKHTAQFMPIMLGVLCGLRRGEIAALRWKSIDLDRGQLAVIASTEQLRTGETREKETKSSRCRTLALPGLIVEELHRHRAEQAEGLLRLGVRLMGENHVVAKGDGSPIKPHSLTHTITNFIKANGIKKIGLHGLRHSHASHMLALNVHPKVVQERLGHSSIAITMDIYSHLMPNMQSDAAAQVDAAIRAAQKTA